MSTSRGVVYFYDYLDVDSTEKTAFLGALRTSLKSLKALRSLKAVKETNTAKMFQNIQTGLKEKGLKGGLNEARKYKSPDINVGKNLPKKIKMPKEQQIERTIGRGIRSAMGNFADNAYTLSKGISKNKGLTKNLKTVGGNVANTIKRQIRGSQVVEKEFSDGINVFKGKDGNEYLKSMNPFAKDRKVLQRTGRGVVVDKRLPGKIISPIVAPGAAGAGLASYTAQSLTQPNKSTKSKIKRSLNDGSRFLLGDAAGVASYLFI